MKKDQRARLGFFFYLQMFLWKHKINHNHRFTERKQPQRLKQACLFSSSIFRVAQDRREILETQACLVCKYVLLFILWFVSRKRETIHRERCCYWSLDLVHMAGWKPHSEWEVYHAILRESHTLRSAHWLTNGRRPLMQLNYYEVQAHVTKGEMGNGTCSSPAL